MKNTCDTGVQAICWVLCHGGSSSSSLGCHQSQNHLRHQMSTKEVGEIPKMQDLFSMDQCSLWPHRHFDLKTFKHEKYNLCKVILPFCFKSGLVVDFKNCLYMIKCKKNACLLEECLKFRYHNYWIKSRPLIQVDLY